MCVKKWYCTVTSISPGKYLSKGRMGIGRRKRNIVHSKWLKYFQMLDREFAFSYFGIVCLIRRRETV